MILDRDKAEVTDFVARNGGPKIVSLSAGTHIFAFHDEWRESALLLVNKNGNQARLIRHDDRRYTMVKTWNSMWDHQDWMLTSAVRFADPEQSVAIISDGPIGGKREMLSFFPKEAFASGQRRLVWRGHILRLVSNMGAGTFQLHPADSTLPRSPDHTGKPWESFAATDWCRINLPAAIPMAEAGIENPHERKVAVAAMAESLQDHALWGQF